MGRTVTLTRRFKRIKWPSPVMILLHMGVLLLCLELSSALVLNHLISPSRLEWFNRVFLPGSDMPYHIPQWVHPEIDRTSEIFLGHRGESRFNWIYVVTLGGSTTATSFAAKGYPTYTEQNLRRKLDEMNSSLEVAVFNFGVGGWSSLESVQN